MVPNQTTIPLSEKRTDRTALTSSVMVVPEPSFRNSIARSGEINVAGIAKAGDEVKKQREKEENEVGDDERRGNYNLSGSGGVCRRSRR